MPHWAERDTIVTGAESGRELPAPATRIKALQANRCGLRPRGPICVYTHTQAGFTLLELVIVITLVIVLFLTAWNRLVPLRGDAEAAHVIGVVGNLESALGIVASETVLHGGLESLAELADSNPMALLQQTPGNYLADRPGEIPPGAWYFDRDSATLRYRVRFPQYLAGAPPAPAELGWRIHVTGDDQPTGVRLVALDDNPYWSGHSHSIRKLVSGIEPGVEPNPDP